MPYGYVADDEHAPVVDYHEEEEVKEEVAIDLSELKEAAVSAQRLSVSRAARAHLKGAMEVAFSDGSRGKTPEKMFHVNRLIEWSEGNPDVVVDALSAGRLRCRLSAKMGLGKSTKLASYVAKRLDYRVLHVALETQPLQQTGIYIHNAGIGKFTSRWTMERRSMVSCMTYADFNGYMATSRRADLFKSFDLIIFDESFVDCDDVFCAKRAFSVYSTPDTNLILCSATIRTDQAGEENGAAGLGNFKVIGRNFLPGEAFATGKMFSEYLVDRSLVLLPDNDAVLEAFDAYREVGVDVKLLDDASDYEAMRDVESWLEGDATTPRVVVAHHSYGIGYNLAVEYVVLFPYVTAKTIKDDRVVSSYVPMTEDMVTQAKSRSGRGIANGSGGVIMSPDTSEPVELSEHFKVRAFVKLCAASIMPIRNNFWAAAYDLFPEGLSPTMAHALLKVCMPVEIALRYFASDGRVAKKYCAALNAFSQPDHFLIASDKENPVGTEFWVKENLICIGDKAVEEILVPYHADGELQVVMHAIEMMAQGRIFVPRWRPTRPFAMNEGYDSEEEIKDPRFGKKPVIRLRRVENVQREHVPEVPRIETIPWAFRPLEGAEGLRRGGYIDSQRCRDALRALEANLLEYRVPHVTAVEVIETSEGSVSPIVHGSGDVESPGGSVVCTLPVGICEKLNTGTKLTGSEMVKLVFCARDNVDRFVGSKLFDCFSNPWDSILGSLHSETVLKEVVVRGVASDAFLLVDRMRGRFSLELKSVLANSHVFRKTFAGLFAMTPSLDKVMRAIKLGRFDAVAQTDAFIARVRVIKEMIDSVLIYAESQNVYLPTHITSAQRALPLRGKEILGYEGSSVREMPKKWARQLGAEGVPKSVDKRYLDGYGR